MGELKMSSGEAVLRQGSVLDVRCCQRGGLSNPFEVATGSPMTAYAGFILVPFNNERMLDNAVCRNAATRSPKSGC